MKTAISIEEIKDKSVHSNLLQALCLMNQARNIVQSAMDEKELRDAGQWDRLDVTVNGLNDCAIEIGYIIGITISSRIETLVK